ncbi:MAG: sigma-54 dependent transcriptional regulator [Planctomycetes bacterium]|nr:sigma-54 dependent transcriptional regulator [Planctomycetota bacterium]
MTRKFLVIANDDAIGRRYWDTLRSDGHDAVVCGPPEVERRLSGPDRFDTILVVQSSPDFSALEILRRAKAADVENQVVILSRLNNVEFAVEAMKEGAADFLHEPCSADDLRSVLYRLDESFAMSPRSEAADSESRQNYRFDGILGSCPAMLEVFSLVECIAPTDATVLVTGESGTGKEMIAHAIHRLSHRCDRPFLGCDCTALAPTLLESELFGHVKGSFSGAIATKKGLFEAAHQGSLLLDEVGNLSMETQGKLLRVLETRQVRKVGDTCENEIDIRLIGTTNRNLGELVKVGEFRADLYYRLNVVPVNLPPLRERSGDIPRLAEHFLERFSHRLGREMRGFSREALRQLEIYAWPGNVRELRNIVERLAVLYSGTRVELRHLPPEIREARARVSTAEVPRTWKEFKALKRQVIDDLESRFLTAALDRCSQNVTQAAESVGMQRPNFHALLRHYGIKPGGSAVV